MSDNDPKPGIPEEEIIDPEVKEEVSKNRPEDPFFTNYARDNSKGPANEKNDIASDFIGDGKDWRPKTFLSAEQIVAMTQSRMMVDVFDELEPIKGTVIDAVENLEKYSVSHGGMGREQAVSVLKSMFSEDEYDENINEGKLLQAFAQANEKKEE